MKKNFLSIIIILETSIILLGIILMTNDFFSSHHFLDLFIHHTPSENLLIEEKNPNSQSKIRIYKIDTTSLFSTQIRVDYIFNNNSQIYSYYTSCLAYNEDINSYNMHGEPTYYSIEWIDNIPYIKIVGHPTISIEINK